MEDAESTAAPEPELEGIPEPELGLGSPASVCSDSTPPAPRPTKSAELESTSSNVSMGTAAGENAKKTWLQDIFGGVLTSDTKCAGPA